MKRSYTAVAKWSEAKQVWRLQPTINGVKKDFTSSVKGRKGQLIVYRNADKWAETMLLGNKTIDEAWPLFMDWYKQTVKPTSAKQMENRGKAHLLTANKHKLIKDYTKADWQQIIDNAYSGTAKSKATLKGIANMITSFCKWCATKGIISDHAVPLYFSMPVQATTGQKKILQPEQLQYLFSENAEDDPYIFCYRFIALTGLRRGEFCALQRERDFDGQRIVVRESISHDGIITDGKSKDKNSVKVLTDLAIEQVNKHAEANGVGNYLFVSPLDDKSVIRPRFLGNRWRDWRARHGIDLTLHELRHTYISYTRLKTAISLDELKQLYGHTDKMDTDRVYVHEITKTPEEIKEERAKAEANAKQINSVFKTILDDKRESKRESLKRKSP